MATEPFTSQQSRRTTRRGVVLSDALARVAVTIGGFGTVASILLVCGFLVSVVLPLFVGCGTSAAPPVALGGAAPRILSAQIDPHRQLALLLADDGRVRAVALADGQEVAQAAVFDPAAARAVLAHDELGEDPAPRVAVVAGADGRVLVCRIRAVTTVVPAAAVPPEVADLAPGSGRRIDDRWCERTIDGAVWHALEVTTGVQAFAGGPVLLANACKRSDGEAVAALTADLHLHLRVATRHVNEITERADVETVDGELALAGSGAASPPDRLLMLGVGNEVCLLWNDGRLLRIDARDPAQPKIAERIDLLPDPARRITATALLCGHETLLIGDDAGTVRACFTTKPPAARGSDGAQIEVAHVFAGPAAPVVALDAAHRDHLFAAAWADGTVRIHQATSERLCCECRVYGAPRAVALAPNNDGLVVATGKALQSFALHVAHAEFSLAAVSLPVWYEGHERPEHSWQTTSGNSDYEPKFGLWPLVFGTLKATIYSLLFGVPLALLAAIYTSEFLHPRWRSRIKPAIEMMASLPSVVLGFLAALVFAPWIEAVLPSLLAAIVCVPFAWLLLGQLVQLLPPAQRVAAERWRPFGVAFALPLGILLAYATGWLATATMFGGDLQHWLATDGDGRAFGGWFLALLPLASAAAALLVARVSWLADHPAGGVLRLLGGAGAALLASAVLAFALQATGADLRGPLLGTYVQRNALVVGFAMGFAVIPIVYTIAEDALNAVPEHLRAASLGAGATPWQTAVRVILPTAMSGIFSAVMVGLGRAVGETMIVLMAAGGTAVLDVNPFNGFRTLSANLATELPEAVRDSTHYRILYLAALVLFALTLALNTAAELVRQRFRRRAWQL
jgi:phosphate transport system permease protein